MLVMKSLQAFISRKTAIFDKDERTPYKMTPILSQILIKLSKSKKNIQKNNMFQDKGVTHVFLVGAKGFRYGGYETFLDKLTEYHQKNPNIKYHIACKFNGNGVTDETTLENAVLISNTEFIYHNAHCFKIKSLNIGSAQAIFYDILALRYCCKYIQKNQIEHPIVYVLSSRIGPFFRYFVNIIHRYGGVCLHNPDGLEFKRTKYSIIVKEYWKLSERLMVKHADKEICDSKNIEKYIQYKYMMYKPETKFIAYGADVRKSILDNKNPKFIDWLTIHGLSRHNYYLVVGRFVPENNFEIMIREFMKSDSKKDFAIITNINEKFLKTLEKKLNFKQDKRIKFVGTMYDKELLMKIRENAYAYFHGHEVGGTNPSLLEALGSTNLNLLLDVNFNKEVAQDAALYWNKNKGNLAALINQADYMDISEIDRLGKIAKERIATSYSWKFIAQEYEKLFRRN